MCADYFYGSLFPTLPLRNELGFLLLYQFLAQDKAVVSAVC